MNPDFHVNDQGSICVLTAISPDARDWMADNIDPEAMVWAGGTVIEHRYVDDIVAGIIGDGLTVEPI